MYNDILNNSTRIYNDSGTDFKKSCPNCGAAIEGDKCQFCGTTFIDFACLDTEQPFYLKFKKNGKIYISKVRLTSLMIETNTNEIFGSNDKICYSYPETTIEANFLCVKE